MNQVCFKLETGDFATVIGPNGAGKTTLLNVIAGVHPSDSGSIVLNNIDITNYPEYKRAWFMARVFQNPNNNLALSMSVEEHLSMAKTGHQIYNLRRGVTKYNRTKFVDQLAALDMGLEKKIKDPAGSLSGGQKQALVLLLATIKNPDLLLLDECTAGLDAQASEHILRLIEKLILEKKITTLMVIHNLEHALRYGNRLLMIHEGSILLDLKQEEKKTKTPQELIARYKQHTGRTYVDNSAMVWVK